MKLIVPKHMFINTTDSFIPVKELVDDPSYIVKGFTITTKYDTFAVDDIHYAKVDAKIIKQDDQREIPGYKIFHGQIYVDSDDASVYTTDNRYIPIKQLHPGISFVSIIKHMVVDIQVDRPTYTRQNEFVEIQVYDLPSVLLSYDEGGTVAMLLFNNKFVQ